MIYPHMNTMPRYRTEVPQLDGGINHADAPDRIADNQLTDGENVWWHESALRTRPGLIAEESGAAADKTIVQPISEQETMLLHFDDLDSDGRPRTNTCRFHCQMLSVNAAPSYAPTNNGAAVVAKWPGFVLPTGFVCRAPKSGGSAWYAFISDGSILMQNPAKTADDPGWVAAEPYIPLVMINGCGDARADSAAKSSGVCGTLYEGVNLLTGAFRCRFTTDGQSSSFTLPRRPLDRLTGHEVTVRLVLQKSSGEQHTVTMTVSPPTDLTSETTWCTDGVTVEPTELGLSESAGSSLKLWCGVTWETGSICFAVSPTIASDTSAASPAAVAAVFSNNLEVTAYQTTAGHIDRICRMRRAIWFGGDRSGLGGGTRLFVSGSTASPNLIHWSDVNNPLYFPENNYAYIGDSSQSVTGFGRQGEALVIFKERELYCAQYVAGSRYSAESVQSGEIADVTAYAAVFPITPLHASIGCDCPHTIRLVNNRLIWADSRGYVYMLPAVSPYHERTVRDISANIRRDLQTCSAQALQNAVACEYNGYYMLFVGCRVFLLSAEDGALTSFTGYADEETARRRLCWFIWQLGSLLPIAAAGDRDLLRLSTGSTVYRFGGTADGEQPIACRFATKRFDFGRPYISKAIRRLCVSMARLDGTLRIAYRTENGTVEDAAEIHPGDNQNAFTCQPSPARLSPNLSRVRECGIQCESDSTFAVGGLTIDYSVQGEGK